MAALSPAGARGVVPLRRSDGVIQPQLLGGAHALWIDGNLEAGRDLFDAAYRVAELEQDPTAMALAAIGLGGLWAEEHRGVVASTRLEMRLRRALAGLEPRSALAFRIRTRLAAEQDHREGKHARIIAILREARRSDDSTARSEASNLAHHCLLGPDHNAVRHRLASDLIGGSVSTGRRSDLLMGVMWRAVDLFLDGASGAERGLEELRQLLASGNHLAVAHVADAIDVMLSVRAGRLHIAETQAASCADHGQAAGAPDSISWHAVQLMSIRWFQGRTTELLPMLRDAVNSPALTTVDRSLLAALAVAAATAGETREAAGAVARLVGEGISAVPRSSSWLMTMHGLAEAAYLLRDAELAAAVHKVLEPYSRLPVMASLGVACFGSVCHALGVASLTFQDADRAVRHLQAAIRESSRIAHWPAVALSRFRLAEALARRSEPGDVEEAGRQQEAAEVEAATLGMELPRSAIRVASVDFQCVGPPTQVRLVRRGRQWDVELGGRALVVDHSLGMLYLSALVANPGYEIPAIDLAVGVGVAAVRNQAADKSQQAVFDNKAKRAYRQRLNELQTEIEELQAMDDAGRVAIARSERDWLVSELANAAGLGSRVRPFPRNDERARISVSRAIWRAMKQISSIDPFVGRKLKLSVQTGRRCCYRPH